MASPASPLDRDEGLLHQLEPEARLVAAIFRQAFRDTQDRQFPVRADAQAFLRGGGSFALLCDVGRLDPARVARLASR